jgi:hypothetical protein
MLLLYDNMNLLRLKNLYERSYWLCFVNDTNVQLSNGSLLWIKNNKINLKIKSIFLQV